ncbi:fatty acid synthase [Trichonephila clavipes]|nr:fatty acid synthase [Trichonephila clavipes]
MTNASSSTASTDHPSIDRPVHQAWNSVPQSDIRYLYDTMHIMVNPKPRSSQWMSSSYSESEWNSAKLADASYFAHILVSPILLHQAMLHIPENAIVVEISPHALSRNVMMDRETEHIRLLEKDVNSTVSLLSCIGK